MADLTIPPLAFLATSTGHWLVFLMHLRRKQLSCWYGYKHEENMPVGPVRQNAHHWGGFVICCTSLPILSVCDVAFIS